MSQPGHYRVSVDFPDRRFMLISRDIELLSWTQELGEHERARVVYYRDTNYADTIDQIVGTRCQVKIYLPDLGDAPPDWHGALFDGLVVSATQAPQLNGGSRWTVELASRSIHLDADRNYRVMPDSDLPAMVRLVAPGATTSNLPATKPADHVQWGESDWAFLVRAAHEAGCFVRIIAGKIEVRRRFSGVAAPLKWGRDLLALSVRATPQNSGAKGWAYDVGKKEDYYFRDRRQEPEFMVNAVPALVGAVKRLATSFPATGDPALRDNQSRARTLGDFRERVLADSERALGESILLDGTSTNVRLQVGDAASIADADGDRFTLPFDVDNVMIAKLTHRWDGQEYRNEFVASPWSHFTGLGRPERQVISGFLSGECVNTDDPLKLGRISVRLHFQKVTDAMLWMRVVAPFAGNERGIQFFPEVGDEVAIGFEEGDPERPYVFGALWNGKDAPPDLKYKQIVTKSGNTIRISDERGKEAIQIFTPNGSCMLQLENATGGSTLTIHSEGDISIEAKDELRIKCRNLVQVVDQDYVRKAGKSEKAAAGMDMTLTSTMVSVSADLTLAISSGAMLNASGTAMVNIAGALVNLNPPGFVKVPVSGASPHLKQSVWSEQEVPDPTPRLKNTADPPPPRVVPGVVDGAAVAASGAVAGAAVAAAASEAVAPPPASSLATTKGKTFIEFRMIDKAGKPVPGLAYKIELPDGTSRTGVLDANGRARFDGIEPGECRITFPNLDKDVWK